jgi:hypothetical protein
VGFALLALQGFAAQFLSYRLFLRASGLLQLTAFFVVLGVFFLKPSYPGPRFDNWMPSFWFLGLFEWLNGNSEFAALGGRAVYAFTAVFAGAAATFALAYSRSIRKIVEQPDIAPGDRSRPAARIGRWVARLAFRKPIDRAIVLFTGRGIARSRQHRLLLAAYMGIGLAIALAYSREYFYGPATIEQIRMHAPWNGPNIPFLVAGMVLLFFAIVGMRAVCAMPIALPANWVFRVTAVHSPAAYFAAVRKAIFMVAALPVWIAAAAVYFAIWPAESAAQHLTMMAALGLLVFERALAHFRKIPFACSYLPGKANLHIRLGAFGVLFLAVADQGASLEFWAMRRGMRFAILLAVIATLAAWAWRKTQIESKGDAMIQFEEWEALDLNALDLHRDGGWSKEEAYIDTAAAAAPDTR